MFRKGEYVVCGNKGVCLVEDVTRLEISGADKEREYYILKPVYMTGSTVYLPADTEKEDMRLSLDSGEAAELIRKIPKIPVLVFANEKLVEQEYRSRMKTNSCEDLIRVIKTIYLRRRKRQEEGRKVTAVDAKYFRQASDNLYGELGVALDLPREAVEACVEEELQKPLYI